MIWMQTERSPRSLSLKAKRRIWTLAFLGVFTLGAIVLECIAGLWHPAGWTIPWTEYLARYVPWPVQLAAYVVLAVWLPLHFWRHDHLRSVAFRRGERAGRYAASQLHGPNCDAAYFKGREDEKLVRQQEEATVPAGVCPACRQDLM